MVIQSVGVRRLVQVRLNPGDDVLLSLREVAQREKLGSAVILNGIGSLSRYHVHVVKTTNLPPGDVFWKDEGPFDILNITGFVIDGRVHAHITFSNTEVAMGGHMEEGCTVLTFSLITLAETPEASFTNWDRVGPLEA